MNYYKQIAEMLGVELGEEFSLKGNNTGEINNARYKIMQEDGLMYTVRGREWSRSGLMLSIINGTYSVVKLPWKPKDGDSYWRYGANSNLAITQYWDTDGADLTNWKIGNCFKTEEEAFVKGKEIMEQIQKEYDEA